MSTKTLAIKVFYGDQLVDTQTLTQDVIKIGKLKSSHICLDDEAVARMHAVIEVSGEEVRVIDLGSATGTVLNGQRIDKNAVLHDGDGLTFGPYRLEVGFVRQAAAVAPVQAAAVAAPVAAAAAAPMAAAPMAAPMAARAPIQIDVSEVEVQNGSRVAEVVAMYGNTVLDVQHVGQIKNRKQQAPILLAVGGLMLVGGAAVMFSDVNQDWDGYSKKVAESMEAGTPRPQPPGNGLAALGIGLAILGLVPFSLGLIRMGDFVNKNYTIGEGHEASFHVPPQGLPEPAAFPLVRGSDHEFALNFTGNMSGEVTFDGQTISLQQLVATGRAGSQGSSYSFPLPPGATARVKYQDVTFFVNSVAPGAVIKGGSETDKPFWIYNGASFVVIGSLLVMTHLIPNEAGELSLDELMEENRFVGYLNQPEQEPPPEEEPQDQENSDEEAGGTGQRHKGEEGKMGKPTSKNKAGLYAMKGPKDAIPQMARNFDPDMAARQAGILGVMSAQSGHFLASPYGGAFAVGNDDADVWGGLTGTEVGEAYGVGGLGLVGTGRGGGGTGEGTIGLGNTGLIGKGGGGGSGSGYGRGAGAGFGGRGTRVPTVRQAKAEVQGALDKDIIRRIVRAHINEVRYCYNQALARDPNAKGRVAVQFTIGGTGKVPSAVVQESTMKDPAVGSCIAQAVRRWTFPKPEGGGSVIVTYPFVLEPG